MAISLLNGCRYCTFGHAYALELAYLQSHGRLFPLGEHEFEGLCGLPAAMIRHRLIGAVLSAQLYTETWPLERAIELALAEDPLPTDQDDVRIVHLVRMFRELNSVGIEHEIAPDEAHSPLNKDSALKTRYLGLRAAANR